jgi:hypothetical protein
MQGSAGLEHERRRARTGPVTCFDHSPRSVFKAAGFPGGRERLRCSVCLARVEADAMRRSA